MSISRMQKAIKLRLSGSLNDCIDSAILVRNAIEQYLPTAGDNIYLEWYRKYIDAKIKWTRIYKWMPISLLGYSDRVCTTFIQDGRLALKDITLPIAEHEEYNLTLIDSLLPYLLSEIDEETLCSFYGFTEGPYEYNSVKLQKGDIVIDAGACVGEFSALGGIKGCRAYAFEPMPHIIDEYLAKTAEWNPNITICNYALSDKQSELDFYINRVGTSSANMGGHGKTKITVPAIDLDTFVIENNLPRVDFIKADIEGAERYMLMGARNVLREFAPKLSLCTYHLPDDPQVMREIILRANPNYKIEERWKKMYAWVEG